MKQKMHCRVGCPVKPELKRRPLITENQSRGLEKTFKTLANSTRLRLIHAFVRENELCVTDIAEMLGMKPTAISNQLQLLVSQGILINRRNGNHILYSILDPCVIKLLDNAWCLVEETKSNSLKGALNEK